MVARKSVVIGGGWLSRLEGYCARKTNVSGEWTAEVPTLFIRNGECIRT
jgi:hypothetical protein